MRSVIPLIACNCWNDGACVYLCSYRRLPFYRGLADFREALASKMPLYPADTLANEYDEDEFVLSAGARART